MKINKTLLSFAVAAALLTGCKDKQDEGDAPAEQATAESVVETAAPASSEASDVPAAAPVATPSVAEFDITSIPVTNNALPAWPYVALPSGYEFDYADDLASRSKDLARVPVWTGGQLLWVEGKVFSDQIDNTDDKTYSKFEVRKNVQQAVEALGGVRLTESTYDEDTYKANEKEISDFRQEFSRMQNAYWYDSDADTYVIRRTDKAIWVVFQSSNDRGALMVAEGPLPEPASK